jgi:hypothetical protein
MTLAMRMRQAAAGGVASDPPTHVGSSSNSTGTTTLSLSKPAGVASGDMMLVAIYTGDAASASITPPSGWTELRTYAPNSFFRFSVFYRVAGASEGASYSFTVGDVDTVGAISAYRGGETGAPASTISTGLSGTSLAAPSITTTEANTMIISIVGGDEGAASAKSWTPPSGVTERSDRYLGSLSLAVGDFTQASAGATGTKTWISSHSLTKGVGVTIGIEPLP